MKPLSQFCCGCSLRSGVFVILVLTLMMNLFYIATATSNVILHVPTIGFGSDLSMQCFTACFSLVGLPFIFGAIYGVINRLESHLRLYLYYAVLSFLFNTAYVIWSLAVTDPCHMLPSVLRKHGQAFACGFARIFVIFFIAFSLTVELYFIYVIWSLCEDVRAGGVDSGLPKLLENKPHQYKGAYVEGFLGTGGGGENPAASVNYGSLAGRGVGGSTRIFGGTNHAIDFTPTQEQGWYLETGGDWWKHDILNGVEENIWMHENSMKDVEEELLYALRFHI